MLFCCCALFGAQQLNAQDSGGDYTPQLATAVVDVSCGTSTDGSISINASGLAAGTYTITFTDENNNTQTITSTVGSPAPIIIDLVSLENNGCGTATGGAIDIAVSGGTAPYSYLWSNDATTEDITGLVAGTYSVTVTDAKGCTATISYDIIQSGTLSLAIENGACNDGTLSAVITEGTAPFTYVWSTGGTSASINDLLAGTYSVTATDATGCSATASITITDVNDPIEVFATTTDQTCGSEPDGSISLEVSGGVSPYSFLWSNGVTSQNNVGIVAGNYSVTISDASGCNKTFSYTIKSTSIIARAASIKQVTCFGGTDGAISLFVSGGTAPYTYVWSTGATTKDVTGVAAGSYKVTVTDANNCNVSTSFFLRAPQELQARIYNSTCNDGRIDLVVSGGTAPYTYAWSNNATTEDLSGLTDGTYAVIVTDAKGCTDQASIVLSEVAPPLNITSTATGPTCSESNGTIDLSVSGGEAPYSFLWSNGATSEDISGLAAGIYQVAVTGFNDCTQHLTIVLDGPAGATLKLAAFKDLTCFGSNDGSLTVAVNGGSGNYTYKWSNGGTSATIDNLTSGAYTVEVADATGCTYTATYQVKEPLAINVMAQKITPSSCSGADGAATISVSGGSAPYTYLWSNGATTQNITQVAGGTYTVTVKDANGCQAAAATFEIPSEGGSGGAVTALIESCSDTNICSGESVDIPIHFNGTGPWSFSYSDGAEAHVVVTTNNPYILKVSPTSSTTYSLSSVSTTCGIGEATGKISVNVKDCGVVSNACADNCFDTKILSVTETATCKTVTMEVSAGNDCNYALSHFSVAVACGSVSNVKNSGGWKVVVGTDPTTGISGFKIDDIKGFGENKVAGKFTVTYTICNTGACENDAFCPPVVAYKAGTCVNFDKASYSTTKTTAFTENFDTPKTVTTYPNPLDGSRQVKVSLQDFSNVSVSISLINVNGISYFNKTMTGGDIVSIDIPHSVPGGVYSLIVASESKYYTNKVMIN